MLWAGVVNERHSPVFFRSWCQSESLLYNRENVLDQHPIVSKIVLNSMPMLKNSMPHFILSTQWLSNWTIPSGPSFWARWGLKNMQVWMRWRNRLCENGPNYRRTKFVIVFWICNTLGDSFYTLYEFKKNRNKLSQSF